MTDAYDAPPATAAELRAYREAIVALLGQHGLHNPRRHGDGLGEVVVHLDEARHYADLGQATEDLYELIGRRIMLYPSSAVGRPAPT